MAKQKEGKRRPTDAEFVILRAIWEIGPATVREISDYLNTQREIGYTTVLKLMQIMTEKGLLKKDSSCRPQIYEASEEKKSTQKGLVADLAERAFSGSAGTLALQALSMESASAEELHEIRKLIDALEEGRK